MNISINNNEKLTSEMINRSYKIMLDQDFIDTYYIVLRIYSEHLKIAMSMMNKISSNVSDYVKNFNLDSLRNKCYIISTCCYNTTLTPQTIAEFTTEMLEFYNKIRYDEKIRGIRNKKENKTYLVEFTFFELMCISLISNRIKGDNDTSRKFFNDGFYSIIPSIIMNANFFIYSGILPNVVFMSDIIEHIKSNKE